MRFSTDLDDMSQAGTVEGELVYICRRNGARNYWKGRRHRTDLRVMESDCVSQEEVEGRVTDEVSDCGSDPKTTNRSWDSSY